LEETTMFEPTKHSITIAAQAADAILALINSKPRNPTKDELVSVLEELRVPVSKLRAEWDALAADYGAAKAKVSAAEAAASGQAAVDAAIAEEEAIADRLSDCAARIVEEPTSGNPLVAEAVCWVHGVDVLTGVLTDAKGRLL
jgi:hypothetical protein